MNQQQFLDRITDHYKECVEIIRKKNADYAGNDDPWRNFRLTEMMGVVSLERAILVRMADKMARVANLLNQEAKVTDEKLSDTLNDLCNYAQILRVYLDEKAGTKQEGDNEKGEGRVVSKPTQDLWDSLHRKQISDGP
jgi:NTP pyrophosphatase (non-canonical NTP hydrolase)